MAQKFLRAETYARVKGLGDGATRATGANLQPRYPDPPTWFEVELRRAPNEAC